MTHDFLTRKGRPRQVLWQGHKAHGDYSRGVHTALSFKLPAMLKRTEVRAPSEFTTADACAFTRELEQLHPDNRHVRDKIRQQLQVLRDAGLLLHIGRGEWRLP